MTSSTATPAVAPSPSNEPNDRPDLRAYLGVVVSWWREVLLLGLLLALLVGAGLWFLQRGDPLTYTAAADVAIVRTVSTLSFDTRITTQPEQVGGLNVTTRRNALVTLADSPALAIEVIAEMGELLSENERRPAVLSGMVSAAQAPTTGRAAESDLIRIRATAGSPEKAAAIATAWARAFVRNVNQVYGQVPDEALASIQQEQSTAEVQYATAQATLEAATASNSLDEVLRRISDYEETVRVLTNGRQELLKTLVANSVAAQDELGAALLVEQARNLAVPFAAEQEGKRGIVTAYVQALYAGQRQLFTEQSERDQQLLAGAYARWVSVTQALGDAAALRAQVAALPNTGNTELTGGSALVLALLKLDAFTQALAPPDTQQMALETTPRTLVTPGPEDPQETTVTALPGIVQSAQPVQVQVGATPLQIQLDATGVATRATLLAELDALTTALTSRRTQLEADIAALQESILSGSSLTFVEPADAASGALADAILAQTPAILALDTLSDTLNSATFSLSPAVEALFRLDELEALAAARLVPQELDDTITALEAASREQRVLLEQERSEILLLTQQRDLARDTLQSVNARTAEMLLARAAGNSEVRFAAPAIAPGGPNQGLSPLIAAAAAGFLGLVAGIVIALLATALGWRPPLTRRSATAA